MSRFFTTGSDSESESSASGDEPTPKPTGGAYGKPLLLSEDEEDTKRVVRSARDKRFEELSNLIRTIRNAMKIRDVTRCLEEWEALGRAYAKARGVLDRDGAPRCYIRILADLEDYLNELWEDKEGKRRMSKPSARALGTLRQKLRKHNRDFEAQITAYRQNPEQSDEDEEKKSGDSGGSSSSDSDEEADVSSFLKKKEGGGGGGGGGGGEARGRFLKKLEEEEEDEEESSDEDWGSDDSDSDSESDEDDGKFTSLASKFLKKDDDKRGGERKREEKAKKKLDRRSRRFEEEDEEGDGEWERVRGGVPLLKEKPKMFAKGTEITPTVVVKKLNEILQARGKKGTDRAGQVELLQLLVGVVQEQGLGVPLELKIKFNIVASLYDSSPNLAACMKPELWLRCLGCIEELLDLLFAHPEIFVGENIAEESENLSNPDQPYRVRGCILTLVERMDEEFTKIMQSTDPHSQEYVEHLKDESRVCAIIARLQRYLQAKGSTEELCRVFLRRILHTYYKFDYRAQRRAQEEAGNGGEEAKDGAGGSKNGAGGPRNGVGSSKNGAGGAQVGAGGAQVGAGGAQVGAGDPKVGGSSKTEVGGAKTEVGGGKTEVGGGKTEVGSSKTEVGEAKVEVGEGEMGPEGGKMGPGGAPVEAEGAQMGPEAKLEVGGAKLGLEGAKLGLGEAKLGLEGAKLGLEGAKMEVGEAKPGLEGPKPGLEGPKTGLEGAQVGPGDSKMEVGEAKQGLEGAKVEVGEAKGGPGGPKVGPEGAKLGLEGAKPGLEGAKLGLEGAKAGPGETRVGLEGAKVEVGEGKAGPEGPKVGLEGPKVGLEGARVGPEGAKVGLEGPKVGLEGARVGPEGARVGPEGAKVGPEGPKVGPEGAKVGPEGPKVGLETPKPGLEGPRVGLEGPKVGLEGARVGPEGARVGPEGAKVGPEGAKVGPEGPKVEVGEAKPGPGDPRVGLEGPRVGLGDAEPGLEGGRVELGGAGVGFGGLGVGEKEKEKGEEEVSEKEKVEEEDEDEEEEDSAALMERLCKFIYARDRTDRIRTCAILCHIYHHALHSRWYQARDLMLMSHLQDNIQHADPPVQILYNRTMVQLGICAFRQGLIKDAHNALLDIQSSGRAKELLGQGLLLRSLQERNPEQEKVEKRRQVPFHMHVNLELLECVYLVAAMLLEIPYMAAHEFDARRRMISKQFHHQLRVGERQPLLGPPESMREHVVAASKAMKTGDWRSCHRFVVNEKMNGKVWDLFPEANKVRAMLVRKIQEESLRTYLFTYSSVYDSISMEILAAMFELDLPTVHSIISKMIINEELMASLDQPTQTVMMHRTEPTPQQNLALQLAEKLGGLVENNERVFDHKQGSYGGYFRDQKDGYRKGDGGYLRRGGYRQQERSSNY